MGPSVIFIQAHGDMDMCGGFRRTRDRTDLLTCPLGHHRLEHTPEELDHGATVDEEDVAGAHGVMAGHDVEGRPHGLERCHGA